MEQDIPNGKNIEVVVGVLIHDDSGKILIVKSKKWNVPYTLPGGHVEFGEKLEDAVKREMKEETNLDAKDIRLLWSGEDIFDEKYHDKGRHFVFFTYSCKAMDPSKVKLNDEATSYLWVTPNEALMLGVSDFALDAIKIFQNTPA